MKKRRMMAFIALGLFLAYIAGALIIFSATDSIYAAKFFAMVQRSRQYDYEVDGMETDLYIKRSLHLRQGMFSEFPYAAAIFDKNGDIVARTGSFLQITSFEDNGYDCCFIDKYLTPEIKRQIVEYTESGKHTVIFCQNAEINIVNGEIVPVKLVFADYNRENNLAPENMLTVTLSDEEGQYKLENGTDGDGYNLWVDFIDLDESHYNHKAYQELYAMIDRSEVGEKAAKYCKKPGGGGYTSSDELEYYHIIEVNGENYCLYQVAKRRPIIETLLSQYFSGYLFSEFILFVILGAVIMFAANKLYDKNRQLEKTRIAFTGAAAHELKTPLAVISNQCECILEDVAPEKNREYVSSIYDEAKRMNRLVMSLLQYNRVSTLDIISREKADLAELARMETEKYKSFFDEKNIAVEIEAEKSEINCNSELIALVIDNFLSNAAKYASENGAVRITVRKGKLTVFNSGSGIDGENARHIWEEFYREDKARTSGNSTGMGLAMCKRILELHGYKYGFNNTENGTEFYFTV